MFPIRVECYIAWIGGIGYRFCNNTTEFSKKKKRPVEMIKVHIGFKNECNVSDQETPTRVKMLMDKSLSM